jgi:hypothetical protein
MFYRSFNVRGLQKYFCAFFVLAILAGCQTLMAFSNEKPSYNHIAIKPIDAPEGFLNARRYRLTYYLNENSRGIRVYPSLEEKKRDYDLILARAVRQYIEDEYFTTKKGMDEHVVEPSNKGEIYDLVRKQYLSAPWGDDNFNALRQYVNVNNDRIMLFTMNVYLDYALPGGGYNSGNDINPVLLTFSKTETGADEVTFIQVNYSDK